VATISPRHVGRLLEADLKPHQSQYWLSPDPQFDEAQDICDSYPRAPSSASSRKNGPSRLMRPGIQALEQARPTNASGKTATPSLSIFVTETLIASFDVASGQVVQGSVGDTRTEADYLAHVRDLIATDHQMASGNGLLKHPSVGIFGPCCSKAKGLDIDLGGQR